MQTPLEIKLDLDSGVVVSDSEMLRYRAALKKTARSMLGPNLRQRLSSSDLVQETLMVTVMNLASLVGRPKRAVYHWMVSVMRHRVLKHARTSKVRQRDEVLGAKSIAMTDMALERDLINAELKELVLKKLATLDELSRRMFELRYLEERELQEIADLMAVSKAAVRGNLYRTLEKIRKELRESVL